MPTARTTSRREFLRASVAGAAGMAAGDRRALGGGAASAEGRARVSIARDPFLHVPAMGHASFADVTALDEGRVLMLLDRALQGLFPKDEAARAWARIAGPRDLVGIKVNTLGGRGLASNVQVVEAICERLQGAGVRAENVTVFDRDTEEMERAGFRIRTGGAGVQCYGTDRVGFEDDYAEYGSVGSRLSKILTRRSTVLINVPVLKDHDGAGVSMALKNMYGVIHNPNKFHPNGCDPYVADVNMLREIRTRLRLTVCDATTACYEGGPAFKPEFTWRANALIVAEDPVALDTIGWQMIEQKRAEKGLKTLEAEGRAPRYIATAADAEHRLGTNDPRRITVVESRGE